MRLVLLFLLIITVQQATSLDLAAQLIKLVVRLLLTNLTQNETTTLTNNASLKIPASLQKYIIGTLNVERCQLIGLNSLENLNIDAQSVVNDGSGLKTNLCLNFSLPNLELRTEYDVDVGIIDEIPIYGEGDYSFAMEDIYFGLCSNITLMLDNGSLSVTADDVDLQFDYRDLPSNITGFWRNEDVTSLVNLVINLLSRLLCMWYKYEKECLSCVLSTVAQYLLNVILPNDQTNTLLIDCPCLGDLFSSKYNLKENTDNFVDSFNEGNLTRFMETNDAFVRLWKTIIYDISSLVDNEISIL